MIFMDAETPCYVEGVKPATLLYILWARIQTRLEQNVAGLDTNTGMYSCKHMYYFKAGTTFKMDSLINCRSK